MSELTQIGLMILWYVIGCVSWLWFNWRITWKITNHDIFRTIIAGVFGPFIFVFAIPFYNDIFPNESILTEKTLWEKKK